MAKRKKYYGGSSNGFMPMTSNDMANMPQEVIRQKYSKVPLNMYDGINDSIRSADYQIMEDMKRKKSGPFPEKY